VRSTSSEAASRSALAVLEVCSSGGTSGGTLLRLASNGRYAMCAKSAKSLVSGVSWKPANPASNLILTSRAWCRSVAVECGWSAGAFATR
jgi:hypothetical protein